MGQLNRRALGVFTLMITLAGSSEAFAVAPLHYSDGKGDGGSGFNLADVGSVSQLNALPANTKGLVYLGLCAGADSAFINAVTPFVGNPKLFGFYLFDEPDPTGQYNTKCSAANFMAESDYIHQHLPGAKTFIVLMNFGSVLTSPTYQNTYNPANSHIDLYGLDPYPCRSGLNGCAYNAVNLAVAAANAAGIPSNQLVPVYQAFGCTDGNGSCSADSQGYYLVPTSAEFSQLLATWDSLLPNPAFDYAYTWAVTDIEIPLSQLPALQGVLADHNNQVSTSTATATATASATVTATATATATVTATATATATVTSSSTSTSTSTSTADKVRPVASITSPVNGAYVSAGTNLRISANASDNIGVVRVDFYVNNNRKCSVSSAPYVCNYKAPAVAGKTLKIQVWAFDAAKNEGGSNIVKVITK